MNQLQEEIADTDPRFKVEQLQKEKKELQHLVNKYQTQKHICTETASIATQTDEVYVITSLSVCLCVCMHECVYVYVCLCECVCMCMCVHLQTI